MFWGNTALVGLASAHSTILAGKPKDTVVVGTSQASKFAALSHAKILVDLFYQFFYRIVKYCRLFHVS